MKEEEKELLLRDICARLPYGVMCSIADYEEEYWSIHGDGSLVKYDDKPVRATGVDIGSKIIRLSGSVSSVYASDDFNGLKPYLRPMSNMTEDERKDWFKYSRVDYDCEFKPEPTLYVGYCHLSIDWLNAHHFDYRGLIDKGLALEAPEGMYEVQD